MVKHLFNHLPKANTLIFLLLLVTAVTITYSNHFNNSFHFDDSHTIQNNLFIQDIKNIPLFFKDGTTFSSLPQNQSYRPIVSASLAIDYRLGNGYNLFYFHLSSFLLYLLQGILLFFLIFKLFDRSHPGSWNFYIAALATSWYMLHPANAETINYIIARSDLQSTFFIVLGLVLYMFSPFSKKYFLYLLPVGIGVLAKPSAVMFAPILFFYVLLFEEQLSLLETLKKENRMKVWHTIKGMIPAFVFCALMYKWVDHFTPATWQSGGTSVYTYLITQPFVIVHYFTTFFLPFGLSADTDWAPLQTIWNIKFFAGCAFILLMLLTAILFSKDERLRPVSFGILWFFLALVPTSSVIPFAEVLNDHRVFFPYIGLVISVCWAAGLFIKKQLGRLSPDASYYPALVITGAVLLLSGYAYGVRQRNKVWNTEETLWKDVTVKSPKNARGLMNYGLSQMAKGNYPEAEKQFLQALSMWSNYSFLYVNLGVLKEATGDMVSSENYFKQGLQCGAAYPDTWFFYGKFLNNRHRNTEAIPALAKAIELSPAHIGARSLLMKVYYETGDGANLTALAQNTLTIIPGNAEAQNYLNTINNINKIPPPAESDIKTAPTAEKYLDLSLQYYQAGKYADCIKACEEALKLKPDFADAYSNICASYNQLKQWDKAIEAGSKALRINPNHKLANGNMNWARTEKAKEKK